MHRTTVQWARALVAVTGCAHGAAPLRRRVAACGPWPPLKVASPRRALHVTSMCLAPPEVGQPRGRGNLFAYLGLEMSPTLEPQVVQKAYHALQGRVHPDQVNVQRRDAEAAGAVEASVATSSVAANADDSAYANVAYETLRDPYQRCRYLAKYKRAEISLGRPLTASEEEGLTAEHEGASAARRERALAGEVAPADPFCTELSSDFLLEMMQINESIFSIDLANNYEEGHKQLQMLEHDLVDRDLACYSDCRALWAKQDWVTFHRCVLQWTYISNALRHVWRLK